MSLVSYKGLARIWPSPTPTLPSMMLLLIHFAPDRSAFQACFASGLCHFFSEYCFPRGHRTYIFIYFAICLKAVCSLNAISQLFPCVCNTLVTLFCFVHPHNTCRYLTFHLCYLIYDWVKSLSVSTGDPGSDPWSWKHSLEKGNMFLSCAWESPWSREV